MFYSDFLFPLWNIVNFGCLSSLPRLDHDLVESNYFAGFFLLQLILLSALVLFFVWRLVSLIYLQVLCVIFFIRFAFTLCKEIVFDSCVHVYALCWALLTFWYYLPISIRGSSEKSAMSLKCHHSQSNKYFLCTFILPANEVWL